MFTRLPTIIINSSDKLFFNLYFTLLYLQLQGEHSVPDKVDREGLSIPDGPKDLVDLFEWHHHNASVLLQDDVHRSSCLELLEHIEEIEVHENFSGTGNASTSLVQQLLAFKQFLSTQREVANDTRKWNGFSVLELS